MRLRPWSLVLGVLLASVAGGACATAQEGDVLVYKGKEYSLYTNPLAGWLQAHPERHLARGSQWTSNWRGYVATWTVDKGHLWLQKVEVAFPSPENQKKHAGSPVPPDPSLCRPAGSRGLACNQTRDLFPEGGPVRADWYSGTLIVPIGELVEYVHMGYGSTYSRYLVVWVRNGEVVRDLELDAKQFTELRRERFEAFKKTETYRKQIVENGKQLGKDAENFMYEFYAEDYLSAEPAP